jgi:CubicO group peptidase (beta-lactamase class C family)
MHYPEFMRGAAGLNVSLEDWYRWADAWAHGRILPRADLEVLWTPAELASGALVSLDPSTSYGCGVMLQTRSGQRSAGHSGGGNAAFRCFIDEDLLVLFATNGKTEEDAFVDQLAKAAREMKADSNAAPR